ncbi:hypothetical protein D9M70_609720 [compost metagenome]
MLVLADGGQLLVDHGNVGGLFDHLASSLQAGVDLAQQVIDGTGALFAATRFVVQAGDAQVFGQPVDLGYETEFIATTGHITQAGPAGKGDQ